MVKSICDDCSAKNCLWRAETESNDPPVMDCEDFKKRVTNVITVADVVTREAFDRILAENDDMREQLAKIGKNPGDKMDDVRPVVRGEWIKKGAMLFAPTAANE